MSDNPNLDIDAGKTPETTWSEAMKDVSEFGSKKLTEEQIKDIYEGSDVYGADQIDFCKDGERLNRLIASMDGWGDVSVFHGSLVGKEKAGKTVEGVMARREEIIREMVGYIVDSYGIEDPPEVDFNSQVLGIVNGGYAREENKMAISRSFIGTSTSADTDEIFRLVAHEMMHCYDETMVSGNGSTLGAMLEYNDQHYNNEALDDYDGYKNQLSERRAYAREEAVMSQFIKFKNNPINRFKRKLRK